MAEMEDGRLISGDGDFTFEQSIAVENPLLWHPDHPHLYTLRSEVYSHGIIVDRQDIRIGIRTIRFDSDNGFMINASFVFRGQPHGRLPLRDTPCPTQARFAMP